MCMDREVDMEREFQSWGAAVLKARSPVERSLVRGRWRRPVSEERSEQVGVKGCRRSVRYVGASPLSALWVSMSNLKMILY